MSATNGREDSVLSSAVRCLLPTPNSKKPEKAKRQALPSTHSQGKFLTSVGTDGMLSLKVERLMENGRAVTYVRNLNGGGQALAIRT